MGTESINDRYIWNVDEYCINLGNYFNKEIYDSLPRTDHDEIYGMRKLYCALCYLQDVKEKVMELKSETIHKYAQLFPTDIRIPPAYSVVKDIYERYAPIDLLHEDNVIYEYENMEIDEETIEYYEKVIEQYKEMHKMVDQTAEEIFTLANMKPPFKEVKARFEEYDPVKEEMERAKEDEYGYDDCNKQIDDVIDDIREIE